MRATERPVEQLVRRILGVAAVLAVVAAVTAGFLVGADFAWGILLGALLACGSFFLMQRDIARVLAQVAAEGAAGGKGSGSPLDGLFKLGFWLRSLARLAVLALLLVALVVKTKVHPIGLVAGLAAIPISVVLVGLSGRKHRLSGIPD